MMESYENTMYLAHRHYSLFPNILHRKQFRMESFKSTPFPLSISEHSRYIVKSLKYCAAHLYSLFPSTHVRNSLECRVLEILIMDNEALLSNSKIFHSKSRKQFRVESFENIIKLTVSILSISEHSIPIGKSSEWKVLHRNYQVIWAGQEI